jgi:hypothetical protein
MTSKKFGSEGSAFTPFERKKTVGVSVELPAVDQHRPQEQQKMVESIKTARQTRKLMFNNIRKLFKENVNRALPCLKGREYSK